MELEFTGRHIEITPTVERLVRKELKKLDRILDSAPMRAHVILSSEKHRQCAEIVIRWRDSVFTGAAENSDIKQSIAVAASKVEKQVLKLKEKFSAKKRQRVSTKSAAPFPDGVIEEAPSSPKILPARRYRVKPMTPEEAADMLVDSADHFLVFRDSETEKVGVMYKRTDGNFGLIEP